jgi:hypothetical protein
MDMVALELLKPSNYRPRESIFHFCKPDEDQIVLQETSNFKIIELNGVPTPWENCIAKSCKKYRCDLYIVLVIQHHFLRIFH